MFVDREHRDDRGSAHAGGRSDRVAAPGSTPRSRPRSRPRSATARGHVVDDAVAEARGASSRRGADRDAAQLRACATRSTRAGTHITACSSIAASRLPRRARRRAIARTARWQRAVRGCVAARRAGAAQAHVKRTTPSRSRSRSSGSDHAVRVLAGDDRGDRCRTRASAPKLTVDITAIRRMRR